MKTKYTFGRMQKRKDPTRTKQPNQSKLGGTHIDLYEQLSLTNMYHQN